MIKLSLSPKTYKRIRYFGKIKELASNDTTLLDFDKPIPKDWFISMLWVSRTIRSRPIYLRIDRTRHGHHIIIKWNRTFSDWQILALQSILGSDYRREALNWFRLDNSPNTQDARKRWNILYERKLRYESKNATRYSKDGNSKAIAKGSSRD